MKALKKATLILGVVMLSAALLLATTGAKEKKQSVKVTLSEFKIVAAKTAFTPGSIEFDAKNAGKIPHELAILKTDLAASALPTDAGKADESKGQMIGRINENSLKKGKSKKQTFKLDAGKYLLICNLVGHYQGGMTAAIEVK
jgi:uncharacterized cupredoxin-like copper-binding protein